MMKESKEGCLNLANNHDGRVHRTIKKTILSWQPEVFLFDINWALEPTKMQILKVLLSFPERFCLQEIFDVNDPNPVNYTIKGLICH